MKTSTRALVAAAALFLLPSAGSAHTGIGGTSGFAHGFVHPLTGLDHILAMVMVGILAWQLGGRALWLVPATFVVVMALGGAAGAAGIGLPLVEIGIALSVVVLGAMVALGIQPPVAGAMAIAGVFAIFHGHAHGAEMPADVGGLGYAMGFMLATAVLHAAGIAAGFVVGALGRRFGPALVRSIGALSALGGIALLTGTL